MNIVHKETWYLHLSSSKVQQVVLGNYFQLIPWTIISGCTWYIYYVQNSRQSHIFKNYIINFYDISKRNKQNSFHINNQVIVSKKLNNIIIQTTISFGQQI
jgi:hypothetical protein